MSPTEKLAALIAAAVVLGVLVAVVVLAVDARASSPRRRRRPVDPALQQLAELRYLDARRRFRS